MQELDEKGVRNVPELACYGVVALGTQSATLYSSCANINADNKSQRTRTQEFIAASYVKRSMSEAELRRRIVERVYYHMVSSILGCSLHQHDNFKELFSAARDIYHGWTSPGATVTLCANPMTVAMLDGENKCQRLHQDISANKVIHVRDRETRVRRAYVIDWEHSL